MSVNKKALVTSREVANKLTMRFRAAPVFTVVESLDASNNPVISINDGTAAAGEQNVVMRIIPSPSLFTNSIAASQVSYGPHICQIVLEATAADAANSVVRPVNYMRVLAEVLAVGCKVEVYIRANGAVPTTADILPANLVSEIQDLYFPFVNDV